MSEMKLTMTTGERRAVKWSVEHAGALSAIDRATVLNLIADIDALEAENGRLKAPVSEEEWETYNCAFDENAMALDVPYLTRDNANALIAARAQQPSPAQDKEQR